ncbi:GNAT family N-acetyltransferase [Streptomyces sp. NPDC088768]|uniref:GNAT family N-acetyltransferase n=1 Tax=Streptomyces sp. NPDC088768 TaxID=3365894 RepID=UPI00382153F1
MPCHGPGPAPHGPRPHDRVALRLLRPADASALTRVYSGAAVRYTTGHVLTLAEARAKIRADRAAATELPPTRWAWGITLGADVIGRITVRRTVDTTASLGYILRPDTWGRGHATDAVLAVLRFATARTGLVRLEARHHPDNPASGRVLVRAGFRRVGTWRRTEGGRSVAYPLYGIHVR